ncbi:DUF2934 domain-containing protein [Jiella sp. MQZ9-1]|nr:DUF2934 domain-containing protein [Jiella flava]MCD2471950.1 DUF2934 domain-containing protein [Jiella flava]
MPRIDEAAEIRALAYQIWEQEGRPHGFDHVHWAKANRVYAELHPTPDAEAKGDAATLTDGAGTDAGPSEVERLRAALWTPEPFSPALFPNEVVETRSVWRRHRDGVGTAASSAARLADGQTASSWTR